MAAITVVVWIGIFAVHAWRDTSAMGFEMFASAGLLALMLGLPSAGVAWAIGRGRGRSRRVRLVSYIGLHVLVLGGFAGVSLWQDRARARRFEAEIDARRQELAEAGARFESIWAKAKSKGPLLLGVDEMEQLIHDGRLIVPVWPPAPKTNLVRAMRAIEPVAEARREVRTSADRVARALRFGEGEGPSIEDMDARLQSVERHVHAVERLDAAWRDARSVMTQSLTAAAEPADDVAFVVDAMFPAGTVEWLRSTTALAQQANSYAAIVIRFLRDRWGRWSLEPSDGAAAVRFEAHAAGDQQQFEVLLHKANEAAEEYRRRLGSV